MRESPDILELLLVPSDDGDPRTNKDQINDAATKAVEHAIRRLAEQHGLKVVEPGAIDPAAKENVERAKKIITEVAPKLVEYSAPYGHGMRAARIVEEYSPDGTLKSRTLEGNAELVDKHTRELSTSLQELNNLWDAAVKGFGISADKCVEIATKVITAVGSLVGAGGGEQSGGGRTKRKKK